MTFVKGHDIEMEPEKWPDYILEIRAGIEFNNEALGKTETWLEPWCDSNHLAWRRGKSMLVAIDKTAQNWTPVEIPTGLMPGTFRELISDQIFQANDQGLLEGFRVPARKACYLVRQL